MTARWVIACTLAEAAGIAVVAVAFAAVSRGLAPSAPAIMAAGAWEGLCLGAAQALFLSALGVRPAPWIAATVAIAAAGYGGALAFGAGGPDPAVPAPDPPLALLVGGAAAMGAGMGALMGAAQALAARGTLPPGRWILANVLGWTPAMVAIFLPAAMVSATAPLTVVALLGAASGAMAGLCVGLATVSVLPFRKGITR
jgi:hypothetical protein